MTEQVNSPQKSPTMVEYQQLESYGINGVLDLNRNISLATTIGSSLNQTLLSEMASNWQQYSNQHEDRVFYDNLGMETLTMPIVGVMPSEVPIQRQYREFQEPVVKLERDQEVYHSPFASSRHSAHSPIERQPTRSETDTSVPVTSADELQSVKDHEPNKRESRVRVTKACDYCAIRRRKCTGVAPCDRCKSMGIECQFTTAVRKRGPRTRKRDRSHSPEDRSD